MKKVALTILLAIPVLFIQAQICKSIKPGMNKSQVIENVGDPLRVDMLGMDNKGDSLFVWNYGNEVINFTNSTVTEVIPDFGKYNQILNDFRLEKISSEEMKKGLDELIANGCK